jgi:asparagine synthetase B (glutamine-hydrolysing)
MSDETGRYTMVFNGEIYNHLALRKLCEDKGHVFRSHMDGEVIVHLWEMEGAACLERLNGIFAIAIVDRVTGELVLARDPLGVKPMVYTVDAAGELMFASEPSALRELGADLGQGWLFGRPRPWPVAAAELASGQLRHGPPIQRGAGPDGSGRRLRSPDVLLHWD